MEIELKKLGKITTGNTPSKKDEKYWDSADICFVKPDGIADEGITLINDSSEYISENARGKARVVSKDAVFVTCIGSIGKVGIADSGDYAFNQQINVIEPNEKVLPRYLAYNLLYSKPRLVAIANAPVVPIINKTQFGEFIVNIEEDKTKQAEIISVLDKLTGIINSRKRELESFDELIKARFVELFGDPSLNTKGYPIKSLSEIAEYWNGLTYKPEDVADEGTIVLRSSNIQNAQLDFEDTVRVTCSIGEKKYVQDNDILMCSRNGSARLVGKVALIKDIEEPMSFGAFMMIIRSQFYPYLMTYFQMPAFRAQITTGATTTINQITGRMLDNVKLPVPEKTELDNFISFIEQVDKSKVAVQKSLDETQKLFDSLMQEYFG
ncbi:restriction endonuclease subunit S [Butyrivibrio sp. TB]|uniref:restriction endonuclease subunit S n=1 Tax=Butyrivibrio sp. TB TaxID=1520809 RepID=UPI0008B13D90|nr:restriction endonuclease subunit S [Butyrivibrio sp. TB]SEQ43090.1 type I restriction enzyme, S subunit [Butyrivibrio sp. TB]